MNDLMRTEEQQLSNLLRATNSDEVRAVEEIRASLTIAKKFPRNEINARNAIDKACERVSLAEVAMYSYPRGGQQITGPSIHLAKALARYWGNIHTEIKEVESNDDFAIVEAVAWDLETNYRSTKRFKVKLERSTKQGKKKLDDSRDVYEIIANMGSRRLRTCILDLIPTDIIDEAIERCNETIKKGDGKMSIEARIAKLIKAFESIGVDREMLEGRLLHKIEVTNAQEFLELQKIYTSIRDGYASRDKYFSMPSVDNSASDINKILSKKE